jgi:hypothetical protein
MGFVVLCGAAIMALHAYIVNKFPQQRVPTEMVAKAQRLAQRRRRKQAEQQRQSLAASDVAPSSAGALPSVADVHLHGVSKRRVNCCNTHSVIN